ncbi:hypothetical protein [Actinoallomurus sp. NPDC052274]
MPTKVKTALDMGDGEGREFKRIVANYGRTAPEPNYGRQPGGRKGDQPK